MALYLVTPLLFVWFSHNTGNSAWKILFVIAITIECNYTIQLLTPAYWEMVEIGLKQVPCFFLGMLVAYYSLKDMGGQL